MQLVGKSRNLRLKGHYQRDFDACLVSSKPKLLLSFAHVNIKTKKFNRNKRYIYILKTECSV